MTTEVSPVLNESAFELIARDWWTIWASLHWGFRKHACVLWCCAGQVPPQLAYSALGIETFRPIDVVVFYREMIVQLVPEQELARRIVDVMPRAERKHLKRFFAGKQVFEAGENRRTIAHLMNEVFMPNHLPRLRESDDSKDARVSDVRLFTAGLRRSIEMRSDDPPIESSKTPLLFVSSLCPELIETIPSLEHDEKHREDSKLVDNEQDSIWEAAKTCFREYPHVIGSVPTHIKRQMEIDKGITPTQRFLNAIEYDRKHSGPQKRTRRR